MIPVVIPYRNADIRHIYGSTYSETLSGPGNMPDNVGDLGPAHTAMVDGMVIGCAGVVMMWEGVGHAWAVFGELFPKFPVFMTKVTKNHIKQITEDYSMKRVQTLIESGNERNMRWAEYLGFEREGTMRRYYHGRDYEMVAIIL